jgi:hypothetical protein
VPLSIGHLQKAGSNQNRLPIAPASELQLLAVDRLVFFKLIYE